MTYRMLACAGAALGLMAGAAVAQIGQERPGQPRQMMERQGQQILQDLEGSWNVEAEIFDFAALTEPARPGIRRPGVQPDRPGVQPGVGVQQIEQQLQQAFTRAGVSQTEAQRHAQQLAQRIQRERPAQQQLQQMLQQTMTQAGVPATQAQQEAQRLAPQIHRLVQQDRGLDPRHDDTAAPVTPREDRPGVQDRPGVADRQHQQVQFRAEGTANREWILNENILREELNFTIEDFDEADPQFRGVDLPNGEFEGYGLFAYEPMNGELCHVWADNTKSQLHYSIAQWDSAAQAMVFYTIDTQQVRLPDMPQRPGITPTPRPGTGGPQVGQERPGQQPGMHDRPGMRPGVGEVRLDPSGTRTMLRIIDDNEHVVEFYKAGQAGVGQQQPGQQRPGMQQPGAGQQGQLVMRLTFTRN